MSLPELMSATSRTTRSKHGKLTSDQVYKGIGQGLQDACLQSRPLKLDCQWFPSHCDGITRATDSTETVGHFAGSAADSETHLEEQVVGVEDEAGILEPRDPDGDVADVESTDLQKAPRATLRCNLDLT